MHLEFLALFNLLRWEKYDAKGWTEKGAHKYGRLNEQSWWEKWGEHYDGRGSVLKWYVSCSLFDSFPVATIVHTCFDEHQQWILWNFILQNVVSRGLFVSLSYFMVSINAICRKVTTVSFFNLPHWFFFCLLNNCIFPVNFFRHKGIVCKFIIFFARKSSLY